MADPRRWEDMIVVRMEGVDVDMSSPRTPLRADVYMNHIGPIIERHLNDISIEVHELFPDAEILLRSETSPRPR